MCKSKVKVRSKKQIRADLVTEIEKDGQNRDEIKEMLGKILNYCQNNNVQPETLLLELGTVQSVAVRVYVRKHQEQCVEGLDHEPSQKEIVKMNKDFNRSMAQLQKFSQIKKSRSNRKSGGDLPASAEKKPTQRNNEDMPYQPSNERPYYIN
jgi:hypothetical protein